MNEVMYYANIQKVTYKWLSRKLEVPTDAAKKVLHAYLVEEGGSSGVTATYVITGFKDTDRGKLLQVLLVRDEELEAAKNGFQSVRSVHVYSVQKTRIQDSGTLFMANYDICKEHISSYSRWSPVACPEPMPPSASTDPHLPDSSSLEKNGSTALDKKNRFPQLDLKKEGGGKAEGGVTKTVKEKETKKDVAKPSKSEVTKTMPRKPDPKKSSSKCKKDSRGSVATYFNKPQTVKTVAQKAETVAKSSVKKLHLNDSDIDNGSDSGGESVVPVAPKPKTSVKVARKKRAADHSAKGVVVMVL
jgi:DNA polymerase delta subunit 3